MKRACFTLLEIMIVVTIIAVIAGMAIGHFANIDTGAKVKLTKTQIKQVEDKLMIYKLLEGDMPGTEDGFAALTVGNNPILEKVPQDGWSRDLMYENPGTVSSKNYDISSYGADGKPGGEGYDADIYNE